jgi:molybdopterin-guanine dinucleotide biosynthesis protein A
MVSENRNRLSVVIQAGGESKRMGRPKALVPFCGKPLLCRSLKRLGGIADELIVTSNDQKSLDFLCSQVTYDKLKMFSDTIDKRSALNGLYTALYYASYEYVAVVACDMVFPSAPLLLTEMETLDRTCADIAVPRTSHGYEPFHAVYRRSTCLPLVALALEAGEKRATSFFDQARLVEFSTEDVLKIDPRGGLFVNVNTPEELATVEKRLMNGEIVERDATADVLISCFAIQPEPTCSRQTEHACSFCA